MASQGTERRLAAIMFTDIVGYTALHAENEEQGPVPSSSTASLPNKVIGAKLDAGGGLIQCDRCGIRISFLDPIPRDVSLWITDPDAGQSDSEKIGSIGARMAKAPCGRIVSKEARR